MDHTEESHVRLINGISHTCGKLALARKEKRSYLKQGDLDDAREITAV